MRALDAEERIERERRWKADAEAEAARRIEMREAWEATVAAQRERERKAEDERRAERLRLEVEARELRQQLENEEQRRKREKEEQEEAERLRQGERAAGTALFGPGADGEPRISQPLPIECLTPPRCPDVIARGAAFDGFFPRIDPATLADFRAKAGLPASYGALFQRR